MHVALTIEEGKDDQLIFAQQLGVGHALVQMGSWDRDRLAAMRNRVEKTGLELVGMGDLTVPSGGEGDVTRAHRAIESAGAAGVPLVRYCWPAVGSPYAAWGELTAFLEAALPVAEEAGVCLTCCSGDLAGGADDWRRLLDTASNSHHGLDLSTEALAGISEADLGEMVGASSQNNGLRMVHLSNRRAGDDAEVPRVLQALQAVGFDGPVETGRPLPMSEDTAWGHTGRALDAGYVTAVLQTLRAQG